MWRHPLNCIRLSVGKTRFSTFGAITQSRFTIDLPVWDLRDTSLARVRSEQCHLYSEWCDVVLGVRVCPGVCLVGSHSLVGENNNEQ